jgi:hypothetical protein
MDRSSLKAIETDSTQHRTITAARSLPRPLSRRQTPKQCSRLLELPSGNFNKIKQQCSFAESTLLSS